MKLKTAETHFIILLIALASCKFSTSQNIVERFNSNYNQRNLQVLKETISPAIKVIDYNGNIVAQNRKQYFDVAILNTIPFGTKWKILELTQSGNIISTYESDSSSINQFLYGGPLKFRYNYKIEDNKITELKYDSISGFSRLEKQAQYKYEILFSWVKKITQKNFRLPLNPQKKEPKHYTYFYWPILKKINKRMVTPQLPFPQQ